MPRRAMTLDEQYWRKVIGDEIADFSNHLGNFLRNPHTGATVGEAQASNIVAVRCEQIARGHFG